MRILIVDDVQEIRELFRLLLRLEGAPAPLGLGRVTNREERTM